VEWGEPTAQFLDQANILSVLEGIAQKAGIPAETGTVDRELEQFWVEDGNGFLDTLQSSTLKEFQEWLDLKPEFNGDLEGLFHHMQALCESWRRADRLKRQSAILARLAIPIFSTVQPSIVVAVSHHRVSAQGRSLCDLLVAVAGSTPARDGIALEW
jgi:hypothetical protein